MKFVFHPAYDSELPVKPCKISEGTQLKAEIGVVYGGELTLLRVLEQNLGIVVEEAGALERSLYFLNILGEDKSTSPAFYSESLKVDPLGTAQTLLKWRDDLLAANWEGLEDPKAGRRIKELAAVHQRAVTLPLGQKDRLANVWKLLHSKDLSFLTVVSMMPLEQCRGLLKKVLHKLGAVEDREAFVSTGGAAPGTDLAILQTYLKTGELAKLSNDGSVVFLDGISDSILARYCTASMARWMKDETRSTAILAGEGQDVFNIAAMTEGLPRTMAGDGDGLRRGAAFLHLLIEIAWNPYNVELWRLFLSSSPNPLPHSLRRKLLKVLSECPGIGSKEWQGAIRSFLEDSQKQGEVTKGFEQLDALAQSWLVEVAWSRKLGARRDELALLFDRVLDWCTLMILTSDDPFYEVMKVDVAALNRVLDLWFVKRDVIDEKSLAALFRHSQGRGRNPQLEVQASLIPSVQHPRALLGSVDRLLVWNVSDKKRLKISPWTIAETEYLTELGCDLAQPFDDEIERTSALTNLLLTVKDRLIIAHSSQILAKAANLHPLLKGIQDELSQCVRPISIDWRIAPSEEMPLVKREGEIRLPIAKQYWKLPPKLLAPRPEESASSIEMLILKPQSYVLKYAARLKAPVWQSPLNIDIIKGRLVHKCFELFIEELKKPSSLDFSKDAVLRNWVAKSFDILVRERSYMLLDENEKAARDQLKIEIIAALRTLQKQIANVDHAQIEAEFGINTQDEPWSSKKIWTGVGDSGLGIPRIHPHLRGSLDLCWTDTKGHKRIIDIKWSGKPSKYQTVLREGKQFQLAVYSALIKEGAWPAAAYMTVPNATIRTLAHDENAFIGSQFMPQNLDSDHPSFTLWSDIQALWVWRWQQLWAGNIEVTTYKAPKPDATPVAFKRCPVSKFELEGEEAEYDYPKLLTGTGRKAV